MGNLHGKAVIGQSGGPTCVINASLVGAVETAVARDEIDAVYGAFHGLAGILEESFVDLVTESPQSLEEIARTPSAALGSVRRKASPEDCQELLRVFDAHGIRYLFYIGGNDSAETAHIIDGLARKSGQELRVCHIPKTIDNDLLVTDHCPGYGSAARFVALALMGDNLDNRALGGVKIDVIMGRHAGFLTAAAALGRRDPDDGPHLIYLPEVAFDEARFAADVKACLDRHGRCVVAVSEGIVHEDGSPVFKSGEKDSHGNVQLSGSGALGDFLVAVVKERLGDKLRVRADTFGYLQRCFPTIHSETDLREAREAGAFAVRSMVEGDRTSGSVAIRRLQTGAEYASEPFLTDLQNVAKHTKELPPEFIAPSGNDVTDAFIEYALPLVGELPVMGRLRGLRIPSRKGDAAS